MIALPSSEGVTLDIGCNARCHCEESLQYNPVCGKGMTYYTACHAGCDSQTANHSDVSKPFI